jgi:hypothetical protein
MLADIKRFIRKKLDTSPLNKEEEQALKFFKDVLYSHEGLKLCLIHSPSGEKGICLKNGYKVVSNIFSSGNDERTELVYKFMLDELNRTPIDDIEK